MAKQEEVDNILFENLKPLGRIVIIVIVGIVLLQMGLILIIQFSTLLSLILGIILFIIGIHLIYNKGYKKLVSKKVKK